MKKYCKNINITDRDLISRAVYNCIDDKYTRSDTLRMLEEYSGVKCEVIYGLVKEYGKHIVYPLVETVIDGISQELLYKKLLLNQYGTVKRLTRPVLKLEELEFKM